MDGFDKAGAERVAPSGDSHESPDRKSQAIFRSIKVTDD
jgi:hypothetical protein